MGVVYRAVLKVRDTLQQGGTFITLPVIVNSTPVRTAIVGDEYRYDSRLWITNVPPQGFSPFLLLNEFSQGTLGRYANGEWIEFLVAVGADMRGYNITNNLATFDLVCTESETWSSIPPGTIIVIYNGDFRDPVLPPDDSDPSDGIMVISSSNGALIALPDNGDGWGEFSNTDPAYIGVQTRYCREIDFLSINGDSTYTAIGDLPDGVSAYSFADTVAGFDDPGNWFVGSASGLPPGTTVPVTPGTVGVTPGAVNNTNNLIVRDRVITDDLTSVPTYSLVAPSPAWLTINPATGELTGTPSAGDVGVATVTIVYQHGFATETQTFTIGVLAGPPLPPIGDRDKDSIINMLEKAFVTDPYTATSPAFGLPMVGSTSVPGMPPTDHLSITFRVPNTAVLDFASQTYTWTDVNGDVYVYEVQYSIDLITWITGGIADLFRDGTITAPDNANVDLATFRLRDPMPGTDPLKYLRIRVTHTPAP